VGPPTTSLSALLPLKVSGRHYGDNLARLDLLFSSLLHFAPGLVDELLVVVRADEADFIGRHLEHWPELPLRVIVEDEHFAAFHRYTRPWQLRPWQRQQIIKLNAPALTAAPFVLTLDPDVVARRPMTRELLVSGGRAVLEPEERAVHRGWWRASADLLDVDPGLGRPGMNVTPAVLSTAVLSELQERLEVLGRRPWMDVLLTAYCEWTEYSLYLLAAERAGLAERHHVWADDPSAPARLHVDPALSIWDAAGASRANVERLFTTDDRGLFAVVQSSAGMSAGEVAAAAADHLPVRTIPSGPPPVADGRSGLQDRIRIGSRLAAQGIHRARRGLRRITRGRASTRSESAGGAALDAVDVDGVAVGEGVGETAAG
jgi:Family of unknown function (DUF6492)